MRKGKQNLKWDKVVDQYVQWMEKNLVPQTQVTYRFAILPLTQFFNKYYITDIDELAMEKFKLWYNVKPRTCNLALAVLRNILRMAKGYKLIDGIPEIKRRPVTTTKDRFLEPDEIRRLLDNSPETLRMMIIVALHTGLRKQNIYHLKWSEITDGSIDVLTKGGKILTIPLPESIQDMLENWKTKSPKLCSWVFPAPDRFPRRFTYQPYVLTSDAGLKRALKKAGIEGVTFHTFRHTFASLFLRKTGNIRLLQEILGHSSITMTTRYSHVSIEEKRNALEKFSWDVNI